MTLILIMALMFFALICIGVPIAFSMGTRIDLVFADQRH